MVGLVEVGAGGCCLVMFELVCYCVCFCLFVFVTATGTFGS